MPHAICKSCATHIHYRNTRGSRIADFTCACGGKYQAAVWDYQVGRYVARKGRSGPRTLIVCALCGKRRVSGGSAISKLKGERCFDVRPWRSFAHTLIEGDAPTQHVTLPAGSEVCWWHESKFPVLVYPKKEAANA